MSVWRRHSTGRKPTRTHDNTSPRLSERPFIEKMLLVLRFWVCVLGVRKIIKKRMKIMRVSVSLHTRTHEPGVDRFKTIAVHWFTESPFASIGLYFSWIKGTPLELSCLNLTSLKSNRLNLTPLNRWYNALTRLKYIRQILTSLNLWPNVLTPLKDTAVCNMGLK